MNGPAHQIIRGEIQGLRAIAVALVLLFHVWPLLVPGGFVGVDVFFVISGYLIVGSLVRETERDGKVSLADFYARRIRRLLPASSIVLACVFAAMFFFLPPARWEDTLAQIIASATYSENWYLASAAVDYLAADNAASPVQHYWSLSIEEQFYIFWPLLLIGVAWIGGRTGFAIRKLAGCALALIFLLSFTASLYLTNHAPGASYFATYTRAWELALGGLLALWNPRMPAGDGPRAVVFLLGISAVLVSGFTFSGVAFPGYAALLPTIGAALVIVAGSFRLGHFQGINVAPLRYIGDISYSLYLWHWPLVVFYRASGNQLDYLSGTIIIMTTVVISHYSYLFIEQRFRYSQSKPTLRPFLYGLASILLLVAIPGVTYTFVGWQAAVAAIPADQADQAALYPGPATLVDNATAPKNVPFIPRAEHLLHDRAAVYDAGCHQDQTHSDVIACEFGDANSTFSIAVIGSSHSVNWLPTLDALGRKNSWRIVSITKASCGFGEEAPPSCVEWHDNLLKYLADHPVEIVFIGENASKLPSAGKPEIIARRWQRLAELGLPILAIRPIPHLLTAPADCLPDKLERCVVPRGEAEVENTIGLAAQRVRGVHVLNMNDAICAKETCGPVVGNVVVYRDKHHLTATYATALAPYFEQTVARLYPGLLPIRNGAVALQLDQPRTEAVLKCGPDENARPFTQSYSTVRMGNRILMRKGDWKNKKKKFEIWEGEVAPSGIVIAGSYRDSRGETQDIRFAGTAKDGVIVARGTRGSRNCTLEWLKASTLSVGSYSPAGPVAGIANKQPRPDQTD